MTKHDLNHIRLLALGAINIKLNYLFIGGDEEVYWALREADSMSQKRNVGGDVWRQRTSLQQQKHN